MLNRLRSPTNPAAALAVMVPLKTSWIIADACPNTPMPAVTLKQRTTHSSQNCGVRIAAAGVTCSRVIMARAAPVGSTQPSGFQPAAGTR